MKINYFWTVLAAAAVLVGCTEEKGHYDYSELLEITLPELPEQYEVEQLERLEISPEWSFPAPRTITDFDYLWMLEGIDGMGVEYIPDTLGREPQLSLTVDQALGNYQLYCFLTDRIDGRKYSISTALRVTNNTATGMLVLSNVEGYAQVSFINSFGQVSTDVYLSRNGRPAGKNPISITSSGVNRNTWISLTNHEHTIFILCDDETGGVVCEPLMFTHIFDMGEMFVIRPEKIRPLQIFTPAFGLYELLNNDGRFHFRLLDKQYPLFELAGTASFEYDLFPYLAYNSISLIHGYCNLNQRFVSFSTGSPPVVSFYEPGDFTDAPFNPGLSTGMEMIFALNLDEDNVGGNHPYRCILKDNAGKKFLYGAMLGGTSFSPVFVSDLSVHPELDQADKFTFTANGTILLAAEGNRIHAFGAEANQLFGTTELDIPAGETIDYIEIDQRSTYLYVGVSTGSRAAGSGSVYIYSINNATGDLTLVESYRNISGQIVDFEWKQMSF